MTPMLMVSPSLEAVHVNMSGHMQHTGMKATKDILLVISTVHVVEPTQATTPMSLTLLAETFTVKHPLQQADDQEGLPGRTPCGMVLAVPVALEGSAVLLLAGSTRQSPPAPQTTLR